ncbi:MAG: serine/threonine protein kinase [Oscillospiraceae bacterium]
MSVDEKYPLALPEGTVLAGQYTINKVLGQGGFGITYKATDYKTNEFVAVKEFFPDTLAYREVTKVISYPGERTENYEYGKEGFLQEAKTLAEFIGCENIVRIHSYFEENGTAYFVMDYIEGISFDEYLKEKGGKITCEEAEKILIPVMDALAIVHSKGIVHRDVTPDNIYITNDGVVKLLDFGAARYSLGDKSRSLDVILKHGFAPKEQYTRRGKQGPFTDVYSLGATFYFALTGRRPPDAVDRLEEDDLIPPSSLGVAITEYQEQAILHALNVSPADRYQSMTEFKNVLINEQGKEPAPAPVQQVYFTAPEQPAPAQPTVTQAIPTPAPVQPTAEQPTEQKKKSNTKTIVIATIAAAAFGFVIISSIVAAIAIPAISKMANGSKDTEEPTDYPATTSNVSFEFPDIIPETTTEPEVTTTAPTKSNTNAVIVGNKVGNIQSYGLSTLNGNFWIDENRSKIQGLKNDSVYTYITGEQNKFSNLIEDKEDLYFLYDSTAYVMNTSTDKYSKVPELQDFNGKINTLYMSEDYFYVYTSHTQNGSDTGTLYRISRTTAKTEQSIDISRRINFIFFNEDLYYIELIDGYYYLRHTDSKNFYDVKPDYRYWSDSNLDVNGITADNGNIYVKVKDKTNKSCSIVKFSNLNDLDDNNSITVYDITAAVNEGGGSISNVLNVYNDNLFAFIYDLNNNNKTNIYKIKLNSNGTVSYELFISNSKSASSELSVYTNGSENKIVFYVENDQMLKVKSFT